MDPRFAVQTCEALLADWQSSTDGGALSQDEDLRVQAIASVGRRQQFLAGRWLARTMLCDALGGAPTDWRITADALTKPQVLDHPVHISIAHSGGFVACAMAAVAVGIDVERVNNRRSVSDMAQLVCSDAEQLALRALPPDAASHAFHCMWTRKEARLKQRGLPFGMAELRTIQTTSCDSEGATVGTWCCTPLGWVLSLAAQDLQHLHARWPAHWRVDPAQWHCYL